MIKESEIDSHGHRYGNYHDYYSFHPSNVRTSLIPNGVFKDIYLRHSNDDTIKTFDILDVGCNEGDYHYHYYCYYHHHHYHHYYHY